jgi:peptidyl-prolyl cis-trans isomerase C
VNVRVLGIAGRVVSASAGWLRGKSLAPASRRGRVGSMVVLVALAIGSGTAVTLDRIGAVPAGSAFRVSGRVVTEHQLGDRVKLLGALYGVQAPTDRGELDRFRRDSAKAVAVSYVLDDAARLSGIVIADKTANDELTHLVETTFPQGRDAFVQKLASLGVTEPAVLDEVKRQLANAQLYDQVTMDVPVPSDQDVAQAYQQRRSEMASPEKRHLRNIVLATEDQANQVRVQLASGADFAAVAGQSSLDEGTKNKGGDLGNVSRDQLDKLYGEAAFTAAPGSVFGPVQSQYGWNIGQVLGISPPVSLSLDQVREQLRADVLNRHKQDAWKTWLGGQLRSAHVRYADTYRPADPDAVEPGPISPK